MFSQRLKWDVQPNPISRMVAQKRAAGIPILDLTESNPTDASLTYPPELLAPLADPHALRYDPDPCGIPVARKAVGDYYAERGVDVRRHRILLTASTSEAYSYLFKLLANPGDEILAPRPSYPLFEFLAGLESVHVRQYPLRYDGVWHIDFDALEHSISPRTRAIVVVNPNNPTGSFLKRAELERLDTLRAQHGLGDSVGRSLPRLRVRAKDADRVSTLAGDRRALTFSMSGLVEDRRPAADEAGLDRGERTGQRCRAGRSGSDRRHVSLGLDAGPGGPPAPAGAAERNRWSRFANARPRTWPDCARSDR